MINQIYQPVDFVFSYTIGAKKAQVAEVVPNEQRKLTEEQRKHIKDQIDKQFSQKKIIHKIVEELKFDIPKLIRCSVKILKRSNKLSKLIKAKSIKITQKERVTTLNQEMYESDDIQPKVKDKYDLDYDKGKVKKVKVKKEYQKYNFDVAYKKKYK
ncbi:hypothetical protein pb186bvf_005506 [Paramecium bursaria]